MRKKEVQRRMTKKKRLALARAAQKAAQERRAREEAEGKAVIARWMSTATRKIGEPPIRIKSALERQHLHRAAARELGRLPAVRHPRVREACRFDLLKFGVTFCMDEYEGMAALLKRPPSPRMTRFIKALEQKILHGGLKHVRWPRGKGKSTWVKIAIIWASLYGHLKFMVVVEKTKGMSQVVVEEIWKRIHVSPKLLKDFPEFGVAMNDIALTPQRIRVQTYNGKPTYIKMDVSKFFYYKLPTLDGFPNTGAIIAYRGADQVLRGINIESRRPDFFFLDDPQSDEDAKNPETVRRIESNINGAVLGSGEINERISAVMASTAIEPDDVSETFADPRKHPEWETETETLVVTWGPVAPMAEYIRRLAVDEADARKFYVEHRDEIERGVEMMDDGDFDPEHEVSAYQHALYLRYTMKESFFAEYQMMPTRAQGVYRITPALVASRVNGCAFGVVPAECDQGILCFVDVNAEAGLRWEIGAFGKGRVVATLAYGQYPAEGQRLYPEGIPEAAIPAHLAAGLRAVAKTVMSSAFIDEAGVPARVRGICFDGGWQTDTVGAVCAELEAAGIPAVWSKGFSTKTYSLYHHEQASKIAGLKNAEQCHLWTSPNGKFLAYNSDYWKEVSQTSYLAEPLTPSSSSFWGESADLHERFAREVCNEELKFKERNAKYGTLYGWHKDRGKPNHFGDTHAGLLAFGAIRGNFDGVARAISAEDLAKIPVRRRKVIYRYAGS